VDQGREAGSSVSAAYRPLRSLSIFDEPEGIQGHIRKGRVRYVFPLPRESPLDDEYVVDFRLIQPITAAALLDLELCTSIGDAIKLPLQGALLVFFTDRKPRKAE
jgi:hypothetical protein